MFDCGMHMGYNDERRFPDFTLLSPTRDFDGAIDALIITHFHLDHCGALPYFTEMCGYSGPIFMTHPTKALCPILLEDYRKITVDRRGESNFFTGEHIRQSMGKVTAVEIGENVFLGPDFEIRAYYAGHVLGAAMFYVRVGGQSVVYTGDFNMTPDRHLGAAWIDRCQPDVLITESTYATTIRESKRGRERDFLKKVHQAVAAGGKVLIPVFALGRVQELCILIETYWERMGLGGEVPIYFSAGMAEAATAYYKEYLGWTNESVQRGADAGQNPFDFKHIRPFEKHLTEQPGPMVLFSTPGMLHSGTSLEVFKKWAADAKNMIIIPGYCVAGTVGAKVLAGAKSIDFEPEKLKLAVNLQVRNLSFSAHADAKGILQLIKNCQPAAVVLVHGEQSKMGQLRDLVKRQFAIPCYMPANGEMLLIKGRGLMPAHLSPRLIESRLVEIEEYARAVYVEADPVLHESLLLSAAKVRSGPLSFDAFLYWTDADRLAGLPPRLAPIDEIPDYTVRHETTHLPEYNWEFDRLHETLQHALGSECIPVKRGESPGELAIRDIRVQMGSGGLLLRWPEHQSALLDTLLKAVGVV